MENDLIRKRAVVDAIHKVDWYHLVNGEMISGASDENSAWYKAEVVVNDVT